MTLEPPGKIVVKPEGPPDSVVTMPPVAQGQIDPEVVEELGPSIMVATLPFGSVVTTPVPHI
jgi:hypothetical protein